MVLVKVPREQKEIYSVNDVIGLQTSAESLRSLPSVSQCFRCQVHGRAQSRCTANIKCVSCGDAHFSRECPRPGAVRHLRKLRREPPCELQPSLVFLGQKLFRDIVASCPM